MRREAELRDNGYEGGNWLDSYIYGILVSEWRPGGT